MQGFANGAPSEVTGIIPTSDAKDEPMDAADAKDAPRTAEVDAPAKGDDNGAMPNYNNGVILAECPQHTGFYVASLELQGFLPFDHRPREGLANLRKAPISLS